MKTPKQVILDALRQYRGDNLECASAAFRGYTESQLDEEYGQSGETCRDILAGYRAHAEEVNNAIKFCDDLQECTVQLSAFDSQLLKPSDKTLHWTELESLKEKVRRYQKAYIEWWSYADGFNLLNNHRPQEVVDELKCATDLLSAAGEDKPKEVA